MLLANRFGSELTLLAVALLTLASVQRVGAGTLEAGQPGLSGSRFLVGPQLERRLQDRITVSFVEQPYRRVVRSLAEGYQLAIFLDRRIDPDRTVTLVQQELALREVLSRLAELGDGEIVWVGPVAYLAPRDKGWQALAGSELCQQAVENFPAAQRQAWQRLAALSWPDFSTPRDLIADLVREIGWELATPEQIPHDLWAGGELPPLTLAEKLGLLLACFDLRPAPNLPRRQVELQPLDTAVRWRRMYRWPLPQVAGPEGLARLLPRAQWEVRGNWLVVLADWSEHRRLMELADASPRRPERTQRSSPERLYTIRQAKGRFESVMRQLAATFGLEVRFDVEALSRAGITPDTPISFSVENATLEELFRAATQAAGCDFRLEGKTLYIFPARKPSP